MKYQLYELIIGAERFMFNSDGEILIWEIWSEFVGEYLTQDSWEFMSSKEYDQLQQKIQEELVHINEQLALRASELQGEDDRGN